jgi:hypothetical protein
VVAGDRDTVEVAHAVFDEVLLDVAHHAHRKFRAEDAGVLRLVFFQNIGLHGAAHFGQGFGLDLCIRLGIDQFVTGYAQQGQAEAQADFSNSNCPNMPRDNLAYQKPATAGCTDDPQLLIEGTDID